VNRDHRPIHPSHLNPAIAETSPEGPNEQLAPQAFSPPKGVVPGSVGNVGRSGLSMMMDRQRVEKSAGPASSPLIEDVDPDATPTMPARRIREDSVSLAEADGPTPGTRKGSLDGDGTYALDLESGGQSDSDDPNSSSALRRYLASEVAREDLERAHERTPLLGFGKPDRGVRGRVGEWSRRAKKVTTRDIIRAGIEDPIKCLPSVILGLLLNVLDGVSYGMIL